jgi:hypothetical protein
MRNKSECLLAENAIMTAARNLIFILGDQLTLEMSSLDGADPTQDIILMCEVMGAGRPRTGPYQQNVPDLRSAATEPVKVAGPDPS